MDQRTLIRSAQLLAVPLPFLLTGYSLCASWGTIPALLDHPPAASTVIFRAFFHAGTGLVVPGNLVGAAAAAYLAYALPAQRRAWAAAAALTLAPLPYTALRMMRGGIARLLEISESPAEQEKAGANLEYRQLLARWARQNYLRTVMYLGSGVVALMATVGA